MAHIEGVDRSQTLLFPEVVDDYVGADNPVRFVEAFVDELDLEALGFDRAKSQAIGRPGYHPGDLLKLYIYGYLNRVRSSRRLEAETHRNIEVIWLLRRLQPDFKTIADFRRQNRAAFKRVFREFVLLCRQLDLFGRELLAVDGTRIKAVNNKDRNFTKATLERLIAQSDERLERYLDRLDAGDEEERELPGGGHEVGLHDKIDRIRARRQKLKGYLATLETSGADQLSLTDPDARAMAPRTKVGVGYNVQIAVDAKYKLIAEQEVHSDVHDIGFLTCTGAAAKDILGVAEVTVVADRGYFQAEDIEAAENAGLIPVVPKPDRGSAKRDGLFAKEDFVFDPPSDSYRCPGGHRLRRRGTSKIRGISKGNYGNVTACRDCPLRPRCTKAAYRSLSRYDNEEVLERMAERLRAHPELAAQRRELVEHPFGSIKHWMNQSAFLMRRLDNVRGEFSLSALAYNLRRALNIVGVDGLIAAVRT